MDPLSATASVIAVIQLSLQISFFCHEYSTKVKDARSDITRLQNELQSFQTVSQQLRELLESPKASKLPTSSAVGHDVLEPCANELEKLLTKLKPSGMRRIGVRSLKWPFTSKEVDQAILTLQRYQSIFNSALQIDQTVLITELDYKIDQAERDRFFSNIPQANGARYNSYEEGNSVCLGGTRTEILSKVYKWADDPGGKFIFWLHGKAETGKSTISRTVAGHFHGEDRLGGSFFFKRGEGDRGDARRFFPTIATQLASVVPGFEYSLIKALQKNPMACEETLREQFRNLLLHPLSGKHPIPRQQPPELVLVLDALDECDKEADIQAILILLAQIQNVSAARLRIFVTSRPDLAVRLGFAEVSRDTHQDIELEEIQSTTIEHDIRMYITDELAKTKKQYLKRPHADLPYGWPSDDIVDVLVERAVPLFIFATTVCRFVSDIRRNPRERLDTILRQPHSLQLSQLDSTYLPILNQLIAHETEQGQKKIALEFLQLIGPIVILSDPLSPKSLSIVLQISLQDILDKLDWLHSVLSIPADLNGPVRLLHLSFRDYLIDPERRDTSLFWVDQEATHARLAKRCLELLSEPGRLKKDLCRVFKPGTRRVEISKRQIETSIPIEVSYACRYWVFHQVQSKKPLHDSDEVHGFLQQHFLHWIEALSWLGRLSQSLAQIKALRTLCETIESRQVTHFLNDANRFMLQNRQLVDHRPLQLYISAILFTPKSSIIRTLFEINLPEWLTLQPSVPKTWSPELQKLEGHDGWINGVAFSHDDQMLASASEDRVVRLWNPATGEETQKLEGHDDAIRAVAFSCDGQILASGSDDNTVRLWNTATGEEMQRLDSHDDSIRAVAFSHDNQILASASIDKTIRLWNPTTGEEIRKLEGHEGWVNSVEFSHDNQTLASASFDKTIRLWDPATGKETRKFKGHEGWVNAAVFSYNSQMLASASNDNTIRLWNPITGEEIRTFKGHKDSVRRVSFSYNGQILASASLDGTVRLWNPITGKEIQRLEGHNGWVRAVAFSYNSQILASSSDDKTIRLWDSTIDEQTQTQKLEGHKSWVRAVGSSHDGQIFASASDDMTIKLWNLATGKTITLEGHTDPVIGVVFSHDDQILASASTDNTIRLWNPIIGKEIRKLEGHNQWVRTLVFSHNSQILASASADMTVRLWDPTIGEEIQKLEGHENTVTAVAFSAYDNQILASSSFDKTIRLWNITTGEQTQKLANHESLAVAFSNDGQILASASSDMTARLWNSATGEEIHRIETSRPITELEFSAGDTELMTDIGCFTIDRSASYQPRISSAMKELGLSDQWIQYNGSDLLWLPPGYRGVSSALHGDTLAMGQVSGAVTILRFNLDVLSQIICQ